MMKAFFIFVCSLAVGLSSLQSMATEYRIGVRAFAGKDAVFRKWSSTAEFLSHKLERGKFELVPIESFEEMEEAVRSGKIDFVLTQSFESALFERRYGSSRIVSLINHRGKVASSVFGSIIITRSDQKLSLEEASQKTIAAVAPRALGGYLMAKREFKASGFPIEDKNVIFLGDMREILRAVKRGQVDVGIVRSDIFAALKGFSPKQLSDFHVVNRKDQSDYSFPLSTQLYPEFSLSKNGHIEDALGKTVASALLAMPGDHYAAVKGDYLGWTPVLSQAELLQLMKELKVGLYERTPTRLEKVIREYKALFILGILFLLALIPINLRMLRLNSQLKDFREKLSSKNAKLQAIINETSIIVFTDAKGVITDCNDRFVEISGYSREELIGKTHRIVKSGNHPPNFFKSLWKQIRQGRIWVGEVNNKRKDGSEYWVHTTIFPELDENGGIVGFVSVRQDITEHKAAQKEVELQRELLSHKARLETLGELSSHLSHELNSPLAIVDGISRSLLRKGELSEEQSSRIEKVLKAAERMSAIINRSRKFSRSEQGAEKTQVEVKGVVEDAIFFQTPKLNKHGVHLEFSSAELPQVFASEVKLGQLLVNLIANSIDAVASLEEKWVRIECFAHEDALEIKVLDSGKGIPDDVASKIFDSYFTSKDAEKGTGVGLAISRKIAQEHGGSLEYSMENGHTCFTLRLPLESAKALAS